MPKNVSYLPCGQRLLNERFTAMMHLGMIPEAHMMRVPGGKSEKM
jgi:hypothetical protein